MVMKWLVLYAFINFLLAFNVSCEFTSWRLPNTTTPIDYNISISVESKSSYQIFEKFSGVVRIVIDVIEETKDVFLHSKLANISEVVLTDINHEIIDVDFKLVPDREVLHIFTANENESLIASSKYIIKITYISELRRDKLGFHLTSYMNADGQKVDIAVTQFAPTEARHAFPCFDEPKFKARFTVSITHPREYHALGNMEMASKNEFQNIYTTTFHRTPLLSTYLVSFIVSNLPHTTIRRPNFTQELYVKDSGQPLVKDGEQFAADVLQKFMETWTTAPLPLTTMKQVAVPNFYFSGMENFGSVFYNEQKWFYDPSIHSVARLLTLKALLSHEMSHQWFGDMVTMSWWTHVWLNEGFATLMGYYGTEMVDPGSKIMQRYQTDVFMNAMVIDEDVHVRQMSQYVEVPDLIMRHYDKIAYDKASCVIRMFENAIGRKEFKKGLDFYFGNMSYKSVDENDLFRYLQEGIEFYRPSDINVKEKMSIWTAQSGLPVLNISVDYTSAVIHVSQERFAHGRVDQQFWPIPLTYVSSSNGTATLKWIDKKVENVTSKNLFEWVLVNVNQTGYYRVNYDQKSWEILGKILKSNYKAFGWQNRAQLVNDAFDMARVNYLANFSLVLDLIHFYQNETDHSPWVVFDKHIAVLSARISGFENFKNFQNFMKFLLFDQHKRVFKSSYESPNDRLARKVILKNSCEFEDCFIDENDVDLRTEYFCSLLRGKAGNQEAILLTKVNELEDVELRNEVFKAFGCGNEKSMRRLLVETLNPVNNWNSREVRVVFESMYKKSSIGFAEVLQFWLENIDDMVKVLSTDGFNDIVVDASKYASTEGNQGKIRTLVENGAIFKPESIFLIEKNINITKQWLVWHKDNIDHYLQQFSGATSRILGSGVLILVAIVLIVL